MQKKHHLKSGKIEQFKQRKQIMNLKELKGEIITKKKALKIIKNHGNSNFSELKDFIKKCGNRANYKTIEVFYWLGY